MTDPATLELHKRRISHEEGTENGVDKEHTESQPSILKSAIKTRASETHKTSKTVSFDAVRTENGSAVLDESLELEDLPLDGIDHEQENGVDEEEDDDDLVIYNDAVEGDNLSGSLSELSRRGTLDSELSTGASGSGRRGEIESLLLAPVDDFDSDSDDSLLDKNAADSGTSIRDREIAAELDKPISGVRTGGRTQNDNDSIDDEGPAMNGGYSRNGKSRTISYGSPITLNQPAFREGFSEVPLMVPTQGGLFDGLVYCDTIDSLGRPVVVLNTSALPQKSLRNQAFAYISQSLEPIVAQGPYVLMFASFKSESLAKVPAAWVVGAYRKLSRPFKKNVEFVVLVRPNRILKGLVKVMSLVVKKKAKKKVKQIKYLSDIERVTSGEVGIQHLGSRLVALMGHDGLTNIEEN